MWFFSCLLFIFSVFFKAKGVFSILNVFVFFRFVYYLNAGCSFLLQCITLHRVIAIQFTFTLARILTAHTFWFLFTNSNTTYKQNPNFMLMFFFSLEKKLNCGLSLLAMAIQAAITMENPFLLQFFSSLLGFVVQLKKVKVWRKKTICSQKKYNQFFSSFLFFQRN